MIDCFETCHGNLKVSITTTNYYECLKILDIYSIQNEKEPYIIKYHNHKVVVHLIPNPGLEIKYNRRTKRKVTSKQSTWTTLLP